MRLVRAFGAAWLLRATALGSMSALVLSTAAPARAQSAADKATARALATDGLKLFQAGRYADALDKLQRAQALYDAPIHLLYIARSQAKLDKLVEAAETYRRLSRATPEPGASAAQKQAVEAAGPELAELEPKIPALRLELEPAGVNGVELRIDGERVPPAVVGVDRSANPGAHTVQAWAPGYNAFETTVTLAAGEKKPVPIRLEAGSGAGLPAQAGGQTLAGAPGAYTPPPEPGANAEKPAKKPSPIGFMAGLRVGAAVPFGDLGVISDQGDDSTLPMSDFVQVGGGGELRAGLRFAKYFTGVLYFSRYVLKPGSFWNDRIENATSDLKADHKAFAQEAGFGIAIGVPRNKLGPFGELDVVLHRRFEVQQDLTTSTGNCSATRTLTGTGLRLIGGVQIPIAKIFNLAPYAGFTGGKSADEWKLDSDCDNKDVTAYKVDDPKSNGLFVIGVGGDFVFGNDLQ